MKAIFRFLGTGSSMGVPVPGCSCSVCLSQDSHNKRFRPAGLIRFQGKDILLDCGPDFREQGLRSRLEKVDGIIMTHAHYDHIGGFDDLRAFFFDRKKPIPCILSQETADDILKRFDYIFLPEASKYMLLPKVDLQIMKGNRGMIDFLGLPVKYLTFEQMGMKVNGIVCGNFAYLSDICHYPESIFQDLKGVEVLVLSALRFTPSPSHFNVDQAIDFAKRVGARETWLTHIAHELDHEKTNAYLPANVRMAYDGLEINFQVDNDPK